MIRKTKRVNKTIGKSEENKKCRQRMIDVEQSEVENKKQQLIT